MSYEKVQVAKETEMAKLVKDLSKPMSMREKHLQMKALRHEIHELQMSLDDTTRELKRELMEKGLDRFLKINEVALNTAFNRGEL